mgnify:CR=1 FL=1
MFWVVNYYVYIYIYKLKQTSIMKTLKTQINLQNIKEFAQTNNAADFDKWCNDNKIVAEWLDIDNIMDLNEGYYNVYLPIYAQSVLYCDGVLQEIS